MAFGTGGVGAMLGESVADGGGAADVGVDGRHDVRRRGRRDAEDVFRDPDTAGDGRGFDTIGADGEHGGHAEESAAVAAALEADLLETVRQAQCFLFGQFVEFRELLVHEGVLGVDELGDGAVVLQQVAEEKTRLILHRGRQVLGVVEADHLARRRLRAEVAKVQPAVEEAVDEAVDAVVGEHAKDLFLQLGGLREAAGPGGGEQLVIGRGRPEGVGEAGGEVVGLERLLRFVGDFAEVEEAG